MQIIQLTSEPPGRVLIIRESRGTPLFTLPRGRNGGRLLFGSADSVDTLIGSAECGSATTTTSFISHVSRVVERRAKEAIYGGDRGSIRVLFLLVPSSRGYNAN